MGQMENEAMKRALAWVFTFKVWYVLTKECFRFTLSAFDVGSLTNLDGSLTWEGKDSIKRFIFLFRLQRCFGSLTMEWVHQPPSSTRNENWFICTVWINFEP